MGIPLGIEGIVNNAIKSDIYVAVNGCKIACATKALESLGIKPQKEVIVTEDMSIKKNKNYNSNEGFDELKANLESDYKEFSKI